MMTRRSLLSRLFAACGVAAVAPIARLLPSEPPVDPVVVLPLGARKELLRVTYLPEPELRLDSVEWVERLHSMRDPIILNGPSTMEQWDPYAGRWVPIKDALAAWNGDRAAARRA